MSTRATDFMVWRAGNSVHWDCTVAEIADETGISIPKVRSILKRRGWECLADNRNTDPYAYLHLGNQHGQSRALRSMGVEL